MKPTEVASQLQENERKILHALEDVSIATTEKLAQATGLGKDAVEKASDWAATKGVVVFNEEVSQFFTLTAEGGVYAKNGLPEENLLNLLKKGPKTLNDLQKSLKGMNIALAWARRNGWVNINKGVLSLTDAGKVKSETSEEKILKKLKADLKVNAEEFNASELEVLDQLIKRKLVNQSETTTRNVAITEFGKLVLPELRSIESERIITQLTPEMLMTGSWKGARFQRYDVTLPVPSKQMGKRHFISQVIDYIRRFWVELGFKEMKGEYLELNFWNFDALYQPQDHPARDLADTFYMKTPYKGYLPNAETVERVKETHENGWTTGSTGWQYKWDSELARRTVLRTHTTSLSVNQIAKLKPEDLPGKFFSVGRVFRNETIDWNHLAEFYQTDGIVIGEGVTFRDMKGYLKAYMEGLGVEKFRFRPGYFPYTEMSMEAEVWIEERDSWMELFGAGMFRPEVVKPLIGVDIPVLAWGPGFDRLVMQSYRVETIKELYSNDIGLLRRAKMWTR
jgi:phenylalanyl-tRNA synthetase alpha chain